jgi:hypothetical protein
MVNAKFAVASRTSAVAEKFAHSQQPRRMTHYSTLGNANVCAYVRECNSEDDCILFICQSTATALGCKCPGQVDKQCILHGCKL